MEKVKIVMEFDMKSAPVSLLWSYISTANGLQHWFADKVEIRQKDYVFYWNKMPQTAQVVGSRSGVYMRFHWEEEEPRTFFEMRITVNELTDGTMLSVTDFADAGDEEDTRDLWSSQVDSLRRVIGCL